MIAEDVQIRLDICKDCPAPCPEYLAGQIDHWNPCANCPVNRWMAFEEPGCPKAPAPRAAIVQPTGIEHGDCNGDAEAGQYTCTEPGLPSLGKMALNLAGASLEELKATLMGALKPDANEIERRIQICRSCESYRSSDQRCSQCGCVLAIKTAWRATSCPLGKW